MKPVTHNTNKIIPPILPDIVCRDRLFKRLNNKQHFSITWITGNAGSGKTTLIADYLQRNKLPHIWFRIDSGDNDLSSFFYYLGMAIQKANLNFQGKMPLLTPEYGKEHLSFSRKYFELFGNCVTPPFYIVFDNYHTVSDDSPIHIALREGLKRLMPGIHTIIISRKDPLDSFAGMIADNHMRILDNFDLAFSYEETLNIIQKEVNIELSENVIRQIHEKSKGWAAGIILLIRSIKHTGIMPKEPDSAPLENVFNYFASELFDELNHSFQLFLIKTALLPRFTSEIACSAIKSLKVDHYLNAAIKDHLFLECSRDSYTVYQYHPLFKEFLLKRGEALLNRKDIRQIISRAAPLFQELGWIEDSFGLYNRLQDKDRLIHIILDEANSLISRGQNKTLLKWLSYIPEKKKNEDPWLIYWMGMGYLFHSMEPAVVFFKQAFNKFVEINNVTGALISWSSLTYCLFIYQKDMLEMEPYIEWFKERVNRETSFQSLEIEACVSISAAAALMCREPQHPDIEYWMQKAITVSIDCHNTRIWVFASTCIITFQIFTNPYSKAHYQNQFKTFAGKHKTDFSRILNYFYESLSFFSSNISADTAKELAGKALNFALTTGLYFCVELLFGLNILLAIILKDFKEAKKRLIEFELMVDHSMPNHVAVYHCFMALYNMAMKDYIQARDNAIIALQKIKEVGFTFSEILTGAILSQAYNLTGQYNEAFRQLEHYKKTAVKSKSLILEFLCGLTESYIYLCRGKKEKALIVLKETLSFGKQYQFTRISWWWNDEMMTRLCLTALKNEIEEDYVRQIIYSYNLIPDSPELVPGNWPFPIEIETLGSLQIRIKGERLKTTPKAKSKVLELFKIIIGLGTKKKAIELIIDALWPEKDGDLAKTAFSTALSRLRKLLKIKDAIITEDGKIGLNFNICKIDSINFVKLVKRGKLSNKQDKGIHKYDIYKQAMKVMGNQENVSIKTAFSTCSE